MSESPPRVSAGLDARVWYLAVGFLAAFSILRGIRFPNLWSYIHVLFNYDHGFVKRGLIGEVATWVGPGSVIPYRAFAAVALLLFVANVVLLGLLARRLLRSEHPVLTGVCLVYASSLALVFLAHTVGFADHVGLLGALILMSLSGFSGRFWVLAGMLPVVILIHEGWTILFLPTALMTLWLEVDQKAELKQRRTVVLLAGAALLATSVVTNARIDEAAANQMRAEVRAKVDHPLRPDAFEVLHSSSRENLEFMAHFWGERRYQEELRGSWAVTLPVVALLLGALWWVARRAQLGLVTRLGLFGASLSPQLLHLVAWDMHRWNTLTITTSFLNLALAVGVAGRLPAVPRPRVVYAVALAAALFSATATIPLFDYYEVKSFPFREHVEYLQDVIEGRRPVVRIPPM